MQTKQLKNNPDVLKTILISYIIGTSFISNLVYAREQFYIYPGDIIDNKINSDVALQQKWYYKKEMPEKFYENQKGYRDIYKYPPLTQKPGSNPITNPQHKYQFPANFTMDNFPYENEHYNNNIMFKDTWQQLIF